MRSFCQADVPACHAMLLLRSLPLLFALILLVAAGPARAAESDHALPGLSLPLKPVLRKQAPQLQQRLQALLAGLQATPQLADPRGVSVHPGLAITQDPELPLTRAAARIHLLPINAADRASVIDRKSGRYQGVGEGNDIEILINDAAHLKLDLANRDAMFYEPSRVGEIAGLPLYQVGGAMPALVIMAPGRPLWLRMTVGEYLERAIREGGASGKYASEFAARQTPEFMTRTACVATRSRDVVGDCQGAEPTYHVRMNPAYLKLDPRRQDAIQLVTVKVGSMRLYTTLERHRREHPYSPLSQALAALEQYHWRQVAAWLE